MSFISFFKYQNTFQEEEQENFWCIFFRANQGSICSFISLNRIEYFDCYFFTAIFCVKLWKLDMHFVNLNEKQKCVVFNIKKYTRLSTVATVESIFPWTIQGETLSFLCSNSCQSSKQFCTLSIKSCLAMVTLLNLERVTHHGFSKGKSSSRALWQEQEKTDASSSQYSA